ncbi:MAG: hypothetical protein CL483_11085 [Acidobacteria bacterium]|nr:hypothetical protein [Acidobacteriota bacterium]|tara:strand:- start:759 stop:1562 length:804 start_codon:yes stop_codon:yes gene_type:complete
MWSPRSVRLTVTLWVYILVLAVSAAAQNRPNGKADETESASLERIRQALAVEQTPLGPSLTELDFRDPTLFLNDGRGRRDLPGFQLVTGIDVWSATSPGGSIPLGGPTHRSMLDMMIPDDVREVASSDVLGIATASAFAVVPYAVRSIANLFRSAPGNRMVPVLDAGQETSVVEATMTGTEILHAGIDQSGRTVELSLVVPERTSARQARRLGRRFVWLVKTNSLHELDPERLLGAGVFDYIVRVVTPSNKVLAEGGKNTTDEQLTW